jgi:hypothetical protein
VVEKAYHLGAWKFKNSFGYVVKPGLKKPKEVNFLKK